jgi:GDPmannose 4,6-dehydratase
MSKQKKRALITGITGQDGSYLAEFLLSKNYQVFGLVRRSSNDPFVRLPELAIKRKVEIIYGNLRDSASLARALEKSQPDEIYNLAAQSDVGISFACPEETLEINYYGLGRLVNEAIKIVPKVKIYQASTSEMFGAVPPPQNEQSKFKPVSPYAEAKLKAHLDFVVNYRERHNLFICSGILFNHESPRRGKHFVTRKITHSLAKIKLGLQSEMALGNLDARRDWGFAGDYVKAMRLMLQQPKPDDYVIATGQSHSVRDFVELASKLIGSPIHWEGRELKEVGKNSQGRIIVRINPEFYRPQEVNHLCGDAAKARSVLGWRPKCDFEKLVEMMVKSDVKILTQADPFEQ